MTRMFASLGQMVCIQSCQNDWVQEKNNKMFVCRSDVEDWQRQTCDGDVIRTKLQSILLLHEENQLPQNVFFTLRGHNWVHFAHRL